MTLAYRTAFPSLYGGPAWLTEPAACRRIHRQPRTLRRWRREGGLLWTWRNGQRVYRTDSLDRTLHRKNENQQLTRFGPPTR